MERGPAVFWTGPDDAQGQEAVIDKLDCNLARKRGIFRVKNRNSYILNHKKIL